MAQSKAVGIVILGAGSIGVSFAAAFADAGFNVIPVNPDKVTRLVALRGRLWRDADG